MLGVLVLLQLAASPLSNLPALPDAPQLLNAVHLPGFHLLPALIAAEPSAPLAPTAQAPGSVGWIVGGIIPSAVVGGFLGALVTVPFPRVDQAQADRREVVVGILGAAGFGVGGYFLGQAARNGSGVARVAVVVLDIAVGLAVVGGVVLVVALSGVGYIPN